MTSYATLMKKWEWQHNELYDKYGSLAALADAWRAAAPPLKLERPLRLWRGVMVARDENPAATAIGLSWSTSFEVAAWFAVNRAGLGRIQEKRGGRPFVFTLNATAKEIITFHRSSSPTIASEREALLEPARLVRLTRKIIVEGTGVTVAELKPDSVAPAEAIARWRSAADAYEAVRP